MYVWRMAERNRKRRTPKFLHSSERVLSRWALLLSACIYRGRHSGKPLAGCLPVGFVRLQPRSNNSTMSLLWRCTPELDEWTRWVVLFLFFFSEASAFRPSSNDLPCGGQLIVKRIKFLLHCSDGV